MIKIGAVLQQHRVSRGLTQSELAGQVRVSAACISSLECDARKPSFKLIADLCAALRIPPEVLLWQSIVIPKGLSGAENRKLRLARQIVDRLVSPPQAKNR